VRQHYLIANLDKMEYFNPADFGGSPSFWGVASEGMAARVTMLLVGHSSGWLQGDPDTGDSTILLMAGRWCGERVVMIGDCHEPHREADPAKRHLPSMNEVEDGFLNIGVPLREAWNRFAEEITYYLPEPGEATALTMAEVMDIVAGETELRRRGGSLAVRGVAPGRYAVASSTGEGKEYLVTLNTDTVSCTCPQNAERKVICKHIVRAGDYILQTQQGVTR